MIEEVLPKEYIKIKFTRDLSNENLRNIEIEYVGKENL